MRRIGSCSLSVKHSVDLALRGMAAVDVEARTMQIRRVIPAVALRRILDLVERASDVILDDFQHRRHLADALPDQILKIARLENADDVVGNILRQTLLDLTLERGRKIVGQLIDLFGG